MENHSTMFAKVGAIPVLSAAASALFYNYNKGRTLMSKNIVTAIETVIFIFAMLVAYYGSITVLGLIIR